MGESSTGKSSERKQQGNVENAQPLDFLRALDDKRAHETGANRSKSPVENLIKAWPGVDRKQDEGYGPAFIRHLSEKPVQGTVETAAGTGIAALAVRYLPAVASSGYSALGLERALPAIAQKSGLSSAAQRLVALEESTAGGIAARGGRLLPRLVSYGAGAYGLGSLVTSDAHDLWTSRSAADVVKYGLASVSDLSMVAGTATRWIPSLKRYNLALTAAGAAGKWISSLLPDSGNHHESKEKAQAQSQARSEQEMVSVRLASALTELRPYDKFVPATADSKQKMPVVIALHGVDQGNARGLMEGETQLNKLAAERGFIAVYPTAKIHGPDGWQDWNSPGSGLTATDSSYDDTEYIKSILEKLRQAHNIDNDRIYVLGFSSGGAFAQHLRGRMPNTFAGVGSIHGTLLGTEAATPAAEAGKRSAFVSILTDSDDMLPASGGRGLATYLTGFGRVAASQPLTQVEAARQANGYGPLARITSVGPVEITDYTPQEPGSAPVLQCMVNGGATGGKGGWLFGRGRDGFPAQHAIDGTGLGGFPLVGEKNRRFDATRFVVDTLMSHKLQAESNDDSGRQRR